MTVKEEEPQTTIKAGAPPAPKVLFVTLEPIARRMAGPAIRCVELAKQLCAEFEVGVFSPYKCDEDYAQHLSESSPSPNKIKLLGGMGKADFYKAALQYDILFIQANVLKAYPRLALMDKYIAVDLYDPFLFSVLVQYKDDPATASSSFRLMHQVLEKHMRVADFSVCASERQRDYWIGRYCALGRITPEMYNFDPSLRKLIDVIPFGLPDEPALRSHPAIKGVVPGIGEKDPLLIWGGGIWDWFDPLTVIAAVGKASQSVKNLRLFFMGMKSPNPNVPLMNMAVRAENLARSLGLLDRHVFFSDRWVQYEERVNFLLEADAGVSAHFDLPETRFSFRTRLLDYFWTNLPVLTTGGDQLAELIEAKQAGYALAYEDVDAWTKAIVNVVTREDINAKLREGSRRIAAEFTWSRAAEPLRQFCRCPHHAPPFRKVTMPSIIERAHAVYSRGGKELLINRSKKVLEDLFS